MGLAALRRGQRITLDGVHFELVGRLPSGNWQLIEVESGLRDEQSCDALWSAFSERRLRFAAGEDPDQRTVTSRLLARLSEASSQTPHATSNADLKVALQRQRYVQEVDRLRGVLPIREIIRETWKTLQWPRAEPPERTVRYWIAKVRRASDPVRALAQHNHRKGNRAPRYPVEIVELADEVVRTRYLQRTPRLTVAKVTEELARRIRVENTRRPSSEQLPIPGRRLTESRIALIPERERISARYGSDAAMVALRTSLGGVKTTHALERGEIDHTLLAIVLLDDDFMPWGRASSSICVDAHTRAVTGFCNGAEVPSIVSVARCTKRSVTPKVELLKQFPDVKGRWDCFGVHETYVLDNGLEEHATAMRQAASELGGSTIEFCPRKAPWFKPHVERHFRRQDLDLLQTLPGCTGENIAARPLFDPKKDMLLRRSTFDKIYMLWLVDIYMRQPQAALGNLSPTEAWKRSITLEDQLVPTRTISLERLFLRKQTERTLDHEGIQYDSLIYNSPDMGALRAQLGARLKVDIWVSDEDLGYIYMDVPGQDVSIRVPCLDPDYASGLTRWQHDKCKAMRRIGEDAGLRLSLDQARDHIGKLIEADFSEFHHARRKKRTRFVVDKGFTQSSNTAGNAAAADEGRAAATGNLISLADRALMRRAGQTTPVLPQTIIES
jgi:putative transposase